MAKKADSKVIKDALLERLVILSEELGEAVQAVGKAARHGLDSKWKASPTNRQTLARELGQVTALAMLMVDAGDIDQGELERGELDKYQDVIPFLHVAENRALCQARVERYEELIDAIKGKR